MFVELGSGLVYGC